MEVLLKERYVTVTYNEEKKCLIQTWNSFCSSDEFRAAQKKTVELFVKKGCKNFITDTTNAGLLKKEDTDWVAQFITPLLIKAGMSNLNMVLPSSAFTKMTVMNLEKAEKDTNQSAPKYFPNLAKALESL